MSTHYHRLIEFFKELKRRKVLRIITVYAASAFVILELVDILAPSLGLPNWTLNLVLLLLCVGFVIAVIVSWIYDIHPEAGLVKTEPADKKKPEDITKSSNGWKVASYISFVIIIGLIVLNIIPRAGKNKALDKSIVVLPFTNLSLDEENSYFIDGMMESILNNLCKIEDLRVPGRTSVMQYRENPKPIPVVAEEMNVAYVLEGSGQKIGNRLLLTVQLLIGNEDRHIWSKQYDRMIEKVEDLIDIQKEIAELVVIEIEAVITPEEKQLIEKIPTTSLTALDFYQRGREEFVDYWWINRDNWTALVKAEDFFHRALKYDSAFAQAYIGLAWIYWSKNYHRDYFAEVFLDSVLILVNQALHYDKELSEAYVILGAYYTEMGEFLKADNAYDQAIRLNPNNWEAYQWKSYLYYEIAHVEYLKNRLKAAQYNRGPAFPGLLRSIGIAFVNTGYFDRGMEYLNQALEFDGDSVAFLRILQMMEANRGNYNQAIQANLHVLVLVPDHLEALNDLGRAYSYTGRFKESFENFERYFERRSDLNQPNYGYFHRIGYACYRVGKEEMAEEFFTRSFDNNQRLIKLNRIDARIRLWPYYNLAGLFAFRGDRDSAYANLRIFNQREMMPLWMVNLIKIDPLFDSIRDEPEFHEIVREVEAKYQAEHERVRLWLEENDML